VVATLPLVEALRRSEAGFAGGSADTAAYASARLTLAQRLRAGVAELPRDDFDVAWSLSQVLRCAFMEANSEEAAAMGGELESILTSDPASPFASGFAFALRDRRSPVPQLDGILSALDASPVCGTRAAALALRGRTATAEPARARAISVARAALGSPCWRMQATALDVLRELDAASGGNAPLPSFLRAGVTP
jgi:hypothetical protein